MNNETQLTVVEQREIDFYEDEIVAVKVKDGSIYVPIRPICSALDLSWPGQRERINRDAVLSDLVTGVRVTRSPERGGTQEMICLPLQYLNGWLFGINANRVKATSRAAVIRYQKECYEVLFEAFQAGRFPTDLTFHELLQNEDSQAVQAYKTIMAMAQMARQQVLLEARIGRNENALEIHAATLDDLTQRLEHIEADMGHDERLITNSQAMQIAQSVKQIALELGKRSKRNEFGGVYGELHRQFSVPGYKQLPASKFDEAMHFLRDWWQALTDSSAVPF